MTNLTPELEAMVEPVAWKYCEGDAPRERCVSGPCAPCSRYARLAISLGARIKVPKSPGQRAYEKYCEVWGARKDWKKVPSTAREKWEQIAAAAREES